MTVLRVVIQAVLVNFRFSTVRRIAEPVGGHAGTVKEQTNFSGEAVEYSVQVNVVLHPLHAFRSGGGVFKDGNISLGHQLSAVRRKFICRSACNDPHQGIFRGRAFPVVGEHGTCVVHAVRRCSAFVCRDSVHSIKHNFPPFQ